MLPYSVAKVGIKAELGGIKKQMTLLSMLPVAQIKRKRRSISAYNFILWEIARAA